jgi:hypothetical protein
MPGAMRQGHPLEDLGGGAQPAVGGPAEVGGRVAKLLLCSIGLARVEGQPAGEEACPPLRPSQRLGHVVAVLAEGRIVAEVEEVDLLEAGLRPAAVSAARDRDRQNHLALEKSREARRG